MRWDYTRRAGADNGSRFPARAEDLPHRIEQL